MVKKIYLVEPQEDFVNTLERTFAYYIDEGKVIIKMCALSDTAGKCMVIREKPGDILATIRMTFAGDTDLCQLDSLFSGETVNFIKADVEGHEMDLLRGAEGIIRRDRPRIAITVYHPENEWKDLRDYVCSIVPGYRWQLKGMVPWGKPLMLHMGVHDAAS